MKGYKWKGYKMAYVCSVEHKMKKKTRYFLKTKQLRAMVAIDDL